MSDVVTPPALPVVALPPEGRSIFKRTSGKVSNLRSTPAVDISNDIGDVTDGDEIEFHGQSEATALYTWIFIQHIPSGKTGWLALYEDMKFDKVDAPPAEPPAPEPLFLRTDLLRLAAIRAQIATLEAEAAAIYTKAADKAAA